jgi:putative ABC transport system permease protein
MGEAGAKGAGAQTTLLDSEPGRRRRRRSHRRRRPRPAIRDVRIGPLVSIYAWRLRHHGLQELLAGIGIAIGVALVFGVLVSSQSITGSAERILHAITGRATLQVSARSPEGFDERLVERIGQLPGVKVAAPLLRADAVMTSARGRQSIQLVGSTVSQFSLGGTATRYLGSEQLGRGLALGSSLADKMGVSAGSSVTILARGRATPVPVHAVWGTQKIGEVADSSLVVVSLPVAQNMLGSPHRVSQVFIVAARGSQARVRSELGRVAAGRLNVQPADHELRVLDAVAQPGEQSSRLFAAIGAIVGFLFAVNAMLLTVPERRRWVADARTHGYSAEQIVVVLGFQALVLGLIASVAGVLLGYALAQTLFSASPEYLTLSFPVGDHPIVAVSAITLALAAGVLATLVASAAPLRDLSPHRPIDAVFHDPGKTGHSIGGHTVLASGAAGALIVVAAIVLALLAPALSIVGGMLLALVALCVVPALMVAAVRSLMPGAERLRSGMLAIALSELEGTATRSIALASVAALAVFGSIAVIGAREDLTRGLDEATVEFLNTADIWVTPAGNNPFLTDPLGRADAAQIASAPGIASVRPYQGSFLDVGPRRIWIRARPPGDRELIQASQLMRGNLAHATALIRAGGWATVSSGFASEHHLGLRSAFAIPTPSGSLPLRVAAITTNSGWPPGAIDLSRRDYERAFQTSVPTALEVNLAPGAQPLAGKQAVERALEQPSALRVQTLAERESQHERDARQGVQSLSEISRMVLIAAVLAIAFALSAAIAARRTDLAARKTEGYAPSQLWRILLLESAVVLGVGALDGVALGILGHALASRWLRSSQGFPAPFSLDLSQLVITLAIIAAAALAVIGLAGYLTLRVPPRVSESE